LRREIDIFSSNNGRDREEYEFEHLERRKEKEEK
jgi:hypothetical protein